MPVNPEYQDLLDYEESDPKVLSASQLADIAAAFKLPVHLIKRIAAGMSATRAEVLAQEPQQEGILAAGNPYHDDAGRFTTGPGPGGGNVRPTIGLPQTHDEQMIKAGFTKTESGAWTYKHEDNQYLNPPAATSRYGTDPAKIRRWAIREGKAVGARGRLHPDIVNEYDNTFGPGEQKVRDAEAEYEKAIAGKEIGSPERKAAFKKFKEAQAAAAEAEKAGASGTRNTSTPVSSDSLYGIKPGATDAERRTAYRVSATKAVPGLERFGGSLRVNDASWDPASPAYAPGVAQHLADLASIPPHLVSEFVGAGGKVIVGDGPITKVSPDLARLSGVQPRGWPAGSSYDDVAGVFDPASGTMVLGNITGSRSKPVSNFALHEFGHGMDQMRKKVALLSAEDEFKALHLAFIKGTNNYINGYYVQSQAPGAGASEFFADSMRGYLKGIKEGVPAEERNHTMRSNFAEAGTFVNAETAGKILDYFGTRFGSAAGQKVKGTVSVPVEPKPKRAYNKTKKMAVKDVTFAEESRARSLKKSGKTYTEISDELKISVGTLSRILGKEGG